MDPYESLFTEPIEEVECVICHAVMPIDDSYPILESTYICHPDLESRCLWEWNNREYVRSELYD